MKKITITLIFILSISISLSFAQSDESCLPDGITFTTQTEIDNFQTNYPDCTEIEGNVWVEGDNITNLNGLSVLTSIGGNLLIGDTIYPYNGNPLLPSLSGLDNLTSIGESLEIRWNGALTSLEGLDNLTSIGGDLWINHNDSLTSLAGLENVTAIEGALGIYYNPALTSLTGMENLTSIGGGLNIEDNNVLTNLAGLENLTSIGGNLSITYNNVLSDCEIDAVCGYLSDPPGTINIYGNTGECAGMIRVAAACGITLPCPEEGTLTLSSQSDVDYFSVVFSGCDTINASVSISGYITNLDSLYALTSIDSSLRLSYTHLTSLQGLKNLNHIGGTFTITANDLLTNFEGLENLYYVGGTFTIAQNDSLTNFEGLESLSSISGSLEITKNSSLVNLSGLGSLNSIGGTFTVGGNASLTNFTGLENLVSIGGDFSVCYVHGIDWGLYVYIGNPLLTNFIGLSSLEVIGGDFIINDNGSLSNLSGLESLDSIHGGLFVGGGSYVPWNSENIGNKGNSSISNLEGIDNLDYIGGKLSIVYNDSLSECEASSICNYLSDPQGNVEIHHNAPSCNNPSEVANACGIDLPCLPFGNYYFFSQTDIDNFQNNYPGCSDLYGDVLIIGDDISNLNELSTIGSIEGGLDIHGNPLLTTLSGLENLSGIGGGFVLGWPNGGQGNPQLNSIEALYNLQTIGGDFEIIQNSRLPNLNGLIGLTKVGGRLKIEFNDSLIYLSGLNNLTSSGSTNISYNSMLTSLEGLEKLDSTGSFYIYGNRLLNIIAMDNLFHIEDYFYIINNDALTCLTGLNNLNYVKWSIRIEDNDSLKTISGLNGLSAIGRALAIEGNTNLQEITGLNNLSHLGGLVFDGNPNLVDLSGLQNIDSVGYLIIKSNDALTSLKGLKNINSINGNLRIVNNPLLAYCEIQAICDYLENPPAEIEILDNAPGCNTEIEIQHACWEITIVDDKAVQNQIIFYPNPISVNAKLSGDFNTHGTINICLYNTTGLCIKNWEFASQQNTQQEFTLNLHDLPPGIYFLRIQAGKEVMTKKVVKL